MMLYALFIATDQIVQRTNRSGLRTCMSHGLFQLSAFFY